MICAPKSLSVCLSPKILTKPSVSLLVLARLFAANGNLPILYSTPCQETEYIVINSKSMVIFKNKTAPKGFFFGEFTEWTSSHLTKSPFIGGFAEEDFLIYGNLCQTYIDKRKSQMIARGKNGTADRFERADWLTTSAFGWNENACAISEELYSSINPWTQVPSSPDHI